MSVNGLADNRITNDKKKLLIDEQLQLADGLTVRGYYNQAINEYKDIIKRFPNSELTQEAWVQLAYTQSIAGKKESALSTYNTFLTQYPKSSIYTAVKVNYARFLGSFDTKDKTEVAIKILVEVINTKTEPEQLKEAASFYLAEIYDNTNKQETAKVIYDSLGAKTLNYKNVYRAYALLKTAQIYSEGSQYNKSIDIYNTLIENASLKKEIKLEAFQSLAVLYTNRKMFEQAADIYGRLSNRFPKTIQGEQAVYYRLECFYQAKKYSILIQEIDSLLNSSSSLNAEKLFFIKACALQQQSLFAEAYKFYLKVLEKKNNSDFYKQSALQSIICLINSKKGSEATAFAIKFSDDKFLPQNIKEAILSLVAEKIGDNSELISFWKKAVSSIVNKKLKIWSEYRLALCFEKGNLPSKALSSFKNILKSKDKFFYPYALYGIMSCNFTLENYKEADKYLEQIISEYSHSEIFTNAILAKVGVSIRNNDYDEAFNILNKYKKELLKSPAWPKVVYFFGCLNYIRANWDEAEINFKEILSNDSLSHREQIESKLYLGLVYIKKDNLKEAIKLLTPIIMSESGNKNAIACKQKSALNYCSDATIIKLGYFFIKVEKYKSAELCFNKLIENNDDNILQEAFLGLAETYLAQNNLKFAIKYYKKAAFIEPLGSDTNLILLKLGKTLLKVKRDEEAVLIFQKILENPTDNNSTIEARMGMARILAKQPDRTLRANRYAMSVFILSKNQQLCIEAMLLSIKLSLQAKNFKEAQNTWNELSRRYPDSLKSEETKEVKNLLGYY